MWNDEIRLLQTKTLMWFGMNHGIWQAMEYLHIADIKQTDHTVDLSTILKTAQRLSYIFVELKRFHAENKLEELVCAVMDLQTRVRFFTGAIVCLHPTHPRTPVRKYVIDQKNKQGNSESQHITKSEEPWVLLQTTYTSQLTNKTTLFSCRLKVRNR